MEKAALARAPRAPLPLNPPFKVDYRNLRIMFVCHGHWHRNDRPPSWRPEEWHFIDALQRDGHSVLPVPFYSNWMMDREDGREVDLVVWTRTWRNLPNPDQIKAARFHTEAPQVWIHWDGFYCPDREPRSGAVHWFRLFPYFDTCFGTEESLFEYYEDLTGVPWRYLDQGCCPRYYSAAGDPRHMSPSEVGFLGGAHANHGAGYDERYNFMSEIAKRHPVRAWCHNPDEWHKIGVECSGPAWGPEAADACASTAIMLGASAKAWARGAWSNRLYTVLASGGFYLTQAVKGLDEIAKPGRHLVTYRPNDLDHCLSRVDYWLKRPELRRKISDAGCRHIRSNHTWLHRARQFVSELYRVGVLPRGRYVEKLLAEKRKHIQSVDADATPKKGKK